jgi:regulator of replication initiation timing
MDFEIKDSIKKLLVEFDVLIVENKRLKQDLHDLQQEIENHVCSDKILTEIASEDK